MSQEVRDKLTDMGHVLSVLSEYSGRVGGGQAVMHDSKTGVHYGSSSPRKDGAAIRCANATNKSRAKLRLVPPPTDSGYDFAVTFTAQGDRRMVAQVLSFRGRQFIFKHLQFSVRR